MILRRLCILCILIGSLEQLRHGQRYEPQIVGIKVCNKVIPEVMSQLGPN